MAVAYTEETASRAASWLASSDSKRRTRPNIEELHSIYAQWAGKDHLRRALDGHVAAGDENRSVSA